MVDEQLSRAVVAYLLGGRYVRPAESPDAVAGALGAEAAEHLLPRLRELAREAACWPVNWQENDDVSAMPAPQRGDGQHSPGSRMSGERPSPGQRPVVGEAGIREDSWPWNRKPAM